MKEVHFATTNMGKVSSIRSMLAKHGVDIVHVPLELPEPRTDDMRKIAKEKALFAYDKIKKPCIALDAGFFVQSLNGFPKSFVNFALETIGVDGILKLIEARPRNCEFIRCLVYMDGKLPEPVFFESRVEGTLAEMPRGEMKDYLWSKLSMVFIPEDSSKTLAEMSPGEYEDWREKRNRDSFATKFAKWYVERQLV